MKYSTLSTLEATRGIIKASATPILVRLSLILFVFSLSTSAFSQSANDLCANAEELIVGDENSCPNNAVDGSTIGATDDGPIDLDPIEVVNGVWYSFEAPANGEVLLNMEAESVQEAAVFDECDGTNLWADFSVESELITGLTPNQTYLLLIYDHPGGESDFTVCLSGSCVNELALECPEDIAVNCEEGSDPSVTGMATATNVNNCDFGVELTFEDEIVSDCPTVIERTWIAFDDQGLELFEECVQTITLIDDIAPIFTVFPEDITVECSIASSEEELIEYIDANYSAPEDLAFIDNCQDLDPFNYTSEVSADFDQECPNVFICTKEFFISDGCNTNSQVWTVTVIDTEAPVFDAYDEVVEVECLEDIPAPLGLTATDECSGIVYDTELFESNTGDIISTCEFTTAFGPGDDWAFWLPTLNNDGLVSTANFVFEGGTGDFVQFGDGTAHLTGTVVNDENPMEKFIVDFWFENAADWTTWSSMGRNYKDDIGCAGPDMLFEDWTYYELVEGFSTLTGAMDLEGSYLSFSHNPASYYFGFQLGEAANNKNCGNGFSGWFYYEGFVNGQAVEGNGDINVDADCQTGGGDECLHFDEVTYLYRAEDECGNADIAVQVIEVNDQTPPMFTVFPEDVTISCEEWPLEIPLVEAEDNCIGEVTILDMVEEMIEGDCPNSYTIERTWRAIDICSNFFDQTQTITVVDNEAPVMDGLPSAEMVVECDEEIVMPVVTATDNCSAEENINIDFTEEIIQGDCPQNYIIHRMWVATDECDNAAEFEQLITVQDTTAPEFVDFIPVLSVECDEVEGVSVEAADNCGTVSIEIIEETLNSGGCMGMLMRIYQATDECGNSTTAEQYITILDTTPPVLEGVPADQEVECSSVMMDDAGFYFDGNEVTATDNCMLDVEISYTEEMQDDGDACENSYIIIRTWMAEDYCGNEAMATQTINVVDSTDPIFVQFPEDLTVECSAEIPELVFPIAEDNCDDEVSITLEEEEIAGSCPNEYTISRVFRATDNCGNEAMGVQIIQVVDTTAPQLEILGNVTIECDEEIPAALFEVTDNCDEEVEVVITENSVKGDCNQSFVLTRTYTATDNCGNVSVSENTITVQDTTAPILTVADGVVIECDDEMPEPQFEVSDNCDLNVDVVVTSTTEEGDCPQEYALTRTYTATDDCGNSVSAVQVIQVVDSTAPVFDPYEIQIEMPCDDIDEAITVSAVDNCGVVEIEYFDELVSGNCADNIIRTYTATDECGNSAQATQIIELIDDVAPQFDTFPVDVTVECSDDIPGQAEGELEITFSDNCGEVELIYVGSNENVGSCPNNYSIELTWNIVDDCDNMSTMTWTVNVEDTTPPILEVAQNETIECTDEIPAPFSVATDLCGIAIVEVTEVEAGDACLSTITRTYLATDECGNSTEAQQVITIVDTTAPSVIPGADVTIECDQDVPAASYVAEDNCNDIEVAIEEEMSGDACESFITRYYTPIDACGNVGETMTQVITIVDTTAPVFDPYEAAIEMPCDDVNMTTVSATDNCQEVTITFEDEIVSGNCSDNIIRTFTATDGCGNSSEAIQIISLIDEVAPEFDSFPADMNFECSDDILNNEDVEGDISFSDNCNEVELIYEGAELTEGNCEYNYAIAYTWTIEDACGNTNSMTWTVTVEDTTPPSIEIDGDYDLSCEEEVPAALFEASDNCGDPIVIIEENTVNTCPQSYVLTRTFTATDACGNSISETQTITVTDNEAPEFEIIPQGGFYSCEEMFDIEEPVAIDNCGITTLSFEDDYDYACPHTYTLIRTWTATDECGNASEIDVVYNVSDDTAPVFDQDVEDVVVECADDIPAVPLLSATDNCGEADVTFIEAILEIDDCGNQIRIVTYTAADECGNSSQLTYSITVLDETAPEFADELEDVVLDCSEDMPEAEELTAVDNCGGEVDVTVTEEIIGELPNPDAIEQCNLEAAQDACDTYAEDWALIFTDGFLDDNDEYKFYTILEGEWLAFEDGTATINATVVSTSNPEAGFTIDVTFENGMDYEMWTSQEFPTGVKSDCFPDADAESWMFYIMQAGSATLQGWGDFEGSSLELTHLPSNYYFGYQVGLEANNQGGSYGSGGWFSYDGVFVDNSSDLEVEVNGAGDLSFKHDCCPQYQIERTYCATDCSGNEYCFTQTLSYGEFDPNSSTEGNDSVFAEANKGDKSQGNNFATVTPNPATERAFIDFTLSEKGNAIIHVYNLSGAKVASIFNQEVESGVAYRAEFNASGLADGIYIYQVVSGNVILTDRIIISK